jgi:hypothetical protein
MTCMTYRRRLAGWLVWQREFEKRRRSPKAERAIIAQERGWSTLRGRGGRREEVDARVGRRNGKPPMIAIDAWMADLIIGSTLDWLPHLHLLPGALQCRAHLNANGLEDLSAIVEAQRPTLETARCVVAELYAELLGRTVSVRTLARKTTAEQLAAARDEHMLWGDSLRFWFRLRGWIPKGSGPRRWELRTMAGD